MIKLRGLSLIFFTLTIAFAFGQNGKSGKTIQDKTIISFRDTVFNIAVDSISHNLGQIVPTSDNSRLVKYFKHTGAEPICITGAWTSDPHFICEYPREPLITNKIYSFTVCFRHQGRQGKIKKVMGFNLSDGNRISFTFTGTYLPITAEEK